MKKYKHIFFDLDRTLWDFDNNAFEALSDIYNKYHLGEYFESCEIFAAAYHKHNEILWSQYRDGNLTKEILRAKRFALCLEEKKIEDPELAQKIGNEYLQLSTIKTRLFPNVHETLEYLGEKYHLYILTNGFRETQLSKLSNCDLDKYFEKVFTSETIGINKPNVKIFSWAVNSVNGKKKECLMIGDDAEVDIAGAQKYGIDTILFNPHCLPVNINPDYEIRDLLELKSLL
jgi:putative hydrolase of the HAD superfamily